MCLNYFYIITIYKKCPMTKKQKKNMIKKDMN